MDQLLLPDKWRGQRLLVRRLYHRTHLCDDRRQDLREEETLFRLYMRCSHGRFLESNFFGIVYGQYKLTAERKA